MSASNNFGRNTYDSQFRGRNASPSETFRRDVKYSNKKDRMTLAANAKGFVDGYFAVNDANRNSKMDKQEFMKTFENNENSNLFDASTNEQKEQIFNALDVNNDGNVDKREMAAYVVLLDDAKNLTGDNINPINFKRNDGAHSIDDIDPDGKISEDDRRAAQNILLSGGWGRYDNGVLSSEYKWQTSDDALSYIMRQYGL